MDAREGKQTQGQPVVRQVQFRHTLLGQTTQYHQMPMHPLLHRPHQMILFAQDVY